MSAGGRPLGLLAVLTTAVLWGTTGTAATLAPTAGPIAIGAAALGVGGLLQAAIAVPDLRVARPALRGHGRAIVLGALAVAVYPLAFYSSMHLAGVAIGTVVSLASAPLASGLLEKLLDGRRLGPWWTLSAGLGVLGAALLCFGDGGGARDTTGTLLGILLGLVAGASYAGYAVVVQRLMQTGVTRAAAMGSVFGAGGALLMPVLLATGAPLLATAADTTVAVYMALVPMFLGYLLFGIGLTRIPASTATTITLAEPAVATLLAVVVGERPGVLGWVGLGLIGAVLVLLSAAPTPVAAESFSAPTAPAGSRSRPDRGSAPRSAA